MKPKYNPQDGRFYCKHANADMFAILDILEHYPELLKGKLSWIPFDKYKESFQLKAFYE